jgi:predicted phosphohydrolase
VAIVSTIYTISDLHLSGEPERKCMSKYGIVWEDHRNKITENWNAIVKADDIVLVNGDTSLGSNFEQALEDLAWVASHPGHVFLCDGNHCSNWWRPAKLRKALGQLGITNLTLTTYEDRHLIGANYVLVGTRGWYGPRDRELFLAREPEAQFTRWTNEIYEHAMLVFYKDVINLRRSLERAKADYPDRRILVQTHFPPRNEMFDLIKAYDAEVCVYGHLHGSTWDMGTEFVESDFGNTKFILASTDFLNHVPKFVANND